MQDPFWGYFFLGPVIIYVLDKLVSISRNKLEISVKSATMLPSGQCACACACVCAFTCVKETNWLCRWKTHIQN